MTSHLPQKGVLIPSCHSQVMMNFIDFTTNAASIGASTIIPNKIYSPRSDTTSLRSTRQRRWRDTVTFH